MIEADVLVVGAGAIGGVAAAKMEGRVRRGAVLDANREHVERMRGEGLRIDDFGEERRERLDAYVDPADLGDHSDFALITLKAPYLERAPSHRCSVARWLRPSFLWATALCGSA